MTKYTGPTHDLLTQKSSKYGTGTPQQEKMTKYTGFEDERQGQGLRCCGWGTF